MVNCNTLGEKKALTSPHFPFRVLLYLSLIHRVLNLYTLQNWMKAFNIFLAHSAFSRLMSLS